MNECKTAREKTVLEEIACLDLDPAVRNRIMLKTERLEEEYHILENKLFNAHLRIDMLNMAIVELSIKRFASADRSVE